MKECLFQFLFRGNIAPFGLCLTVISEKDPIGILATASSGLTRDSYKHQWPLPGVQLTNDWNFTIFRWSTSVFPIPWRIPVSTTWQYHHDAVANKSELSEVSITKSLVITALSHSVRGCASLKKLNHLQQCHSRNNKYIRLSCCTTTKSQLVNR